MLRWLDKFPYTLLLILALLLASAPPQEPHLYQKIKMLMAGTLSKPLDIFDLVMHSAPFILLLLKGIRDLTRNRGNKNTFS